MKVYRDKFYNIHDFHKQERYSKKTPKHNTANNLIFSWHIIHLKSVLQTCLVNQQNKYYHSILLIEENKITQLFLNNYSTFSQTVNYPNQSKSISA